MLTKGNFVAKLAGRALAIKRPGLLCYSKDESALSKTLGPPSLPRTSFRVIFNLSQNSLDRGQSRKIRFSEFPGSGLKKIE